MAEAYTGHDRTALFLSGGAANNTPSASLGGLISSRLVMGMVPQYDVVVPGVIVEDATPENLEGEATIAITNGVAVYTPPDGDAGAGVAIAEGERKILYGADPTKAIRLYRPAGYLFSGVAEFKLVDALNGVLGMGNVPHADRIAGATYYRAFFVKALGDANSVKLWVTTTGQSAYALAYESPVSGAIQTIANEKTSPTGRTWVNAVSEGTALALGSLTEGQTVGVWIRRTFPAAGVAASKETMNLYLQHLGV